MGLVQPGRELVQSAVADLARRIEASPPDPFAALLLLQFDPMTAYEHQALWRQAVICVIENDPYYLATSMSFSALSMAGLPLTEVRNLCERIRSRAPRDAAFLEAMLWCNAVNLYHCPEDDVRQCLAALEALPRETRETQFLESLLDCYRRIDYRRFVDASELLLGKPGGRPASTMTMLQILEASGQRKDWITFDRWRERWNHLPATAHFCECYQNKVANLDGLRALEHAQEDLIPGLLRHALDTKSCPHLASFGPAVDLVLVLLRRGMLVPECKEYLRDSRKFGKRNMAALVLEKLEKGVPAAEIVEGNLHLDGQEDAPE